MGEEKSCCKLKSRAWLEGKIHLLTHGCQEANYSDCKQANQNSHTLYKILVTKTVRQSLKTWSYQMKWQPSENKTKCRDNYHCYQPPKLYILTCRKADYFIDTYLPSKNCLFKITAPKIWLLWSARDEEETGENCIIRCFIICGPCQILLQWLNQGG
jgi:hypothetical protein